MVVAIRHRAVGSVPQAGNFVMAGDSINDPYTWGPFPGGQGANTLAAAMGWTRVGTGIVGQNIVQGGGSGYTANFAATFVGGTFTRAAAATAIVWGGAVIGLSFTDYGAYTVAPTGISGGAGTGATTAFALAGGAIADSPQVGNNSRDATRAAIGGTTLVSGGSKGADFVANVAARCTAYSPVAVAINLGTNDYFQSSTIAGFTSIAKFKADYQTAVAAILAASSVRYLLVCGLLPLAAAVALPAWATSAADLRRQFNQAIHETALANGAAFCPLDDFPPALFHTDGIHPTQGPGQAWVGQRMVDTVRGRF